MHYFDISHQHSLFAAEADPSDLITNYPQVEATLPELLKLIENINALDDKRSKLVEDFRNYGHYERCKLFFNFFLIFFTCIHAYVIWLFHPLQALTHTHTQELHKRAKLVCLFVDCCFFLFCTLAFFLVLFYYECARIHLYSCILLALMLTMQGW